jgi:hypothetical protein
MSEEAVRNLHGRQGLITLDPAGQLYTNHLAGVGPATEPVRGHFQPMIVPTDLKELCAGHTALTPEMCARCSRLLSTLDIPMRIDCSAPNREGWLTVSLEADGLAILTW